MLLIVDLDILRHGDDSDTADKREAIAYLEEALKKRDDYVRSIVDSFEDERVSREALVDKVSATFFRTYDLRMAITGRKLQVSAEPAFKESPVPQHQQQ